MATEAPPPDDDTDASSKMFAHTFHERQREDRKALQRVNRYLDAEDTQVSSYVSDDESVDTRQQMGTGNRAYEPEQFTQLMDILEEARARPTSAPAAMRRRASKAKPPIATTEGPAPAPQRRRRTTRSRRSYHDF